MQQLPNHILVLLYEITNSLIKKYANLPTTQYNCLKTILKVLPLVEITKGAIFPQYITQFKNSFVKRVLNTHMGNFKDEEFLLNT